MNSTFLTRTFFVAIVRVVTKAINPLSFSNRTQRVIHMHHPLLAFVVTFAYTNSIPNRARNYASGLEIFETQRDMSILRHSHALSGEQLLLFDTA